MKKSKPKKRLRFIRNNQVPNPVAVATLDGMLDAVSDAATDAGIKTEVPALRAIFGMLIAGAIESSKGTTINVEGVGPIKIRPIDAQTVGIRSLASYSQLLTRQTLRKQAKAKK